ncbi:hypothetical protein [Parasitella parasitica]|uniref:Uncharacterized protein n=1 Tax=Parasitella parasitica TaxID=35722 RepID=A0A0B7NFI4_9FUNG|nr:hypothetical protein [Parasitella parasitica]
MYPNVSSRSYRINNNPSRVSKVVDAYKQAEPSTPSNAEASTSSIAAETSSNAHLTIPSSEISGDTEASVNSTTPKMEVKLCIDSLQFKGLRGSTVRNYTPALLDWKVSDGYYSDNLAYNSKYVCIYQLQDYCDTCRSKFPINSEDLYTVGPPEMVVAFFTEFIFQRVTPKQISLNTDANVRIAS